MKVKLESLFNWKLWVALLAAFIIFASVGKNNSGLSTRVFQPVFGTKWIKEESFYFRVPFFSKIVSYSQEGTVASSDNESIVETASLVASPRTLQFSDSYEIRVEWSLRYVLPISDEELEAMHKAVKSERNLLGNTIMPFAQTLAGDTAAQMLAGEFAQGGKNQFRSLMNDQAINGLFMTEVEKVKVQSERADGELDRNGDTKLADQFIRKVVYLTDESGKKLRRPLSISQYGIKVVPDSVNVIETNPIGRLVEYIDKKQENIAKQIQQEEEQKLLREKAKTSQLDGERLLIERTNQLNIQKAEAIIGAERKVEEAKLQAEKEVVEREKEAELAIIDKKRELQIANDNEGIQEANFKAAKYEAQAIREKGFAEAEVAQAKLKAKQQNSTIYLAELALEEAKYYAEALPKVKIDMPEIIMNGSGEGSAVSDLLSTKLVKDIIGGAKEVNPTGK